MSPLLLAVTGYWFCVMPPCGEYDGERTVRTDAKGTREREVVVVSHASARAVSDEASARLAAGGRILVDIDHESHDEYGRPNPSFDPSRLVGEVTATEVRDDGSVAARIVFTDFGAGVFGSNAFTHVSPAFVSARPIFSHRSRMTKLLGVSLTNSPHERRLSLVPYRTEELAKVDGRWEVVE